MARRKKRAIEKQIEVVAKKLSIFTLNDLEVLLEKPRLELIPSLEFLVSKKILKHEDNSYIFLPPKNKAVKAEEPNNQENSLVHCLPFDLKNQKKFIYATSMKWMDLWTISLSLNM